MEIPAGIINGYRKVIKNEGELSEDGGDRGDLIVLITVEPHPFFKRDNNDCITDLNITMVQACMGANLQIPGLYHPIIINILPGTQPGDVIIVKEQGFPSETNPNLKGDLKLNIIVEIPRIISEQQKTLLQNFEKLFSENK